MKISFIICLHSSRIKNLFQLLRFLEKREKKLQGSELVILFHDYFNKEITSSVFDIKKYNLNLQIYNKPFMCNLGVEYSINDKIVILDSDRILPDNYFYNNAVILSENDFFTVEHIQQCEKEENDDSIENNSFNYTEEERSKENKINCKNLFSGNVMFYIKKYKELGGMDETFLGYSFNDNDITQKVLNNSSCNIIYHNQYEVHLYHEKQFFYKEYFFTKEEKEVNCVANMLKYCNKWNIEVNERYREAKLYVKTANDLKNEVIKKRFFDEYNKVKFGKFI